MNNQKYIWSALGIVLLVLVIWLVSSNKPATNDAMMEKAPEAMMDKEPSSEDSMMESDKMMEDTDSMMEKSGSYKEYSEATVEAEQTLGNKVVLFFHAPWCPFCKAANTAFLERINEIPSGVTVLKTDYDSNTALRQQYGVTYQHTFVQIDNSEEIVTKWNGGDIDNLKKYVK